ncbi:hypothetical protein RND71_038439 [Anisodus tanguticus]|uniref:Uncharacterized protein n=1 Tax=Anisodus tanguticus TaxID=243964 RepID=A0AAE1US43_9SOLA|nr:hypothetical protein RND71_038439 [Anisodus tanguticus]
MKYEYDMYNNKKSRYAIKIPSLIENMKIEKTHNQGSPIPHSKNSGRICGRNSQVRTLGRGASSAGAGFQKEQNFTKTQNVETNGSASSSTPSRYPTDQVGKIEQINCNGPGDAREDEMVEAAQHENKKQRKQKRTIMNKK